MRIQVQESTSEEQIQSLVQDSEILSDEGLLEKSTLHHTWFIRTFGPMKKGSLRQSVIALVCTAMGSGMLAFPSNPKESGLGFALIIMVLCALLSRFSMHLLMKCSFTNSIESYSKLVEFTFGVSAKRAFSIDVILYTFGSIVGYQVLFIQFVWQCCQFFKINDDYHDYVRYFGGAGFMLLNFPVSMLKDVYSLRYFTHLQILIIAYTTIAIIVHFFQVFQPTELGNSITWFKLNLSLPCTFASTFFGFICHQLIFPVRTELHRASFKRMSKIFNRAVGFETLIYSLLMCFGYLTFFDNTEDIIVDNYNDVVFVISKGLFAVVMFFAVPINLNPSRLTLLQMINKEDNKTAYFLTTLGLQFFSGALAMIYPQVKSIFGLLGGLLGMIMAAALPGMLFVKLQLKEGTKLSDPTIIVTIVIMSLATIFGFSGAILSQMKSVIQ